MDFELIIFDLGNVIFLYDHHIIVHKISKLESIPEERIHHTAFRSNLYNLFDTGKIKEEDFFNRFKEKLELKMDFKTFIPIWNNIFTANKGIINLIKKLKIKYKIFVLSNTNSLHFNYLMQKFSIMKEIKNFVLSFEIGSSKPHPDVYKSVLNEAKVKPEKAIFIDDYLEFIEGAKRLNIRGIHFKNAHQLKQELTSLGIEY